jgi:hypothetical protein
MACLPSDGPAVKGRTSAALIPAECESIIVFASDMISSTTAESAVAFCAADTVSKHARSVKVIKRALLNFISKATQCPAPRDQLLIAKMGKDGGLEAFAIVLVTYIQVSYRY